MPLKDLEVRIVAKDDIVTVTLVGEAHFDFDASDKYIQAVMAHKPRTVLVDASGLSFMSSIGMCFLINLRRVAKEAGGTMRITALQPLVRKAMEHAHVIHLFEVPPEKTDASETT
jgi:anti-anti-sigma factor